MNTNRVIGILRYVTMTVNIMPFVFVVAQLAAILSFIWVDDSATTLIDLAVYVSPLVIIFEVVLSYLLELCVWHRLQCSLPLIPLTSVIVDDYIYPLTEIAAELNFGFVIFLSLASLFNGYMLFCRR